MDEDTEHKKGKGTKTGVIKRELMFKIIKIVNLIMKSY